MKGHFLHVHAWLLVIGSLLQSPMNNWWLAASLDLMSLEWFLCLSPSKRRRGQTSPNLLGGQLLVPISSPLIPEIMGSSTQGAVTDFYQPVWRAWSGDVMHTEVKVQTRRLHLKHVKRIHSVISLDMNCVTLSDLSAGLAASYPVPRGGGDLRLVTRAVNIDG